MLTTIQRAVVQHEVARKMGGYNKTMMTVKEYAEALGISRETYYKQVSLPEVMKAVEELTAQAEVTKDYAALVFRQAALEQLMLLAKDKKALDRDRMTALKQVLAETKFAEVDLYEVPYADWSDEDLLEEALGRKERLGLSTDEIRELAKRA
jgi:hypothetical protein